MSTSSSDAKRIILVIGATGAQGIPIVKLLLKPSSDGKPSPYHIRAITRDPTHRRAKELEALGVELFQGSFMDFDGVVKTAMKGAYGAFVNTDGFAVGAMAETYAGIKLYEAAKAAGLSGWKEIYRNDFFEAKDHVADYIKAQPNEIDDPNGTMWSIITTGPYMEMMNVLFAPIKQRPDGTYVFAFPLGDGHLPLIAISDIAFWTKHIFEKADANTTGVEFGIVSEMATGDHIAETFTKVTGHKAEYKRLTTDEYMALWETADVPLAYEVPNGSTFREAFSGFWATWRDDVIPRDLDLMKRVNPETMSLERWMKESKYDGSFTGLLKNYEEKKTPVGFNVDKIQAL